MEEFRHELQDVLTHLHDPDFEPAEQLYAALGCGREQGSAALQLALVRRLESLQLAEEGASDGQTATEMRVLHQRFVAKLTQEETANRLHMSLRTLQRVQRRAVYLLARDLWKHLHATPTRDGVETGAEAAAEMAEEVVATPPTTDWRAQVQDELASLGRISPNPVADVGGIVASVVKIGQAAASKRGVIVQMLPSPPLSAAIHSSALRQALLTVLERVVQTMTGGEITLHATGEGGVVCVTVSGAPTFASHLPALEVAHEIIEAYGGSLETANADRQLSVRIRLPAIASKIRVLVVDDNSDLVTFYQRFLAGTRYEITHLTEGKHLFAQFEANAPDIIVLDVLLPDIDGWELLTYLHEHPRSRTVPAIVSSVVRGEELALALGAAAYLPKPVRRQEFIQTLDRVLALAQTPAWKTRAQNAITG